MEYPDEMMNKMSEQEDILFWEVMLFQTSIRAHHLETESIDSYENEEQFNEATQSSSKQIIDFINIQIIDIQKNTSEKLMIRLVKTVESEYSYYFKNNLGYSILELFSKMMKYQYNLGHTDAWIYLDEYLEKINKNVNEIRISLNWKKGNLKELYDSLISIGILSEECPILSLESVFNNNIKKQPFIFGKSKSVKKPIVHLFDILHNKGFTDLTELTSVDAYLGYYIGSKPSGVSSLRHQPMTKDGKTIKIYDDIERIVNQIDSNFNSN
jgi:hypothetical protein